MSHTEVEGYVGALGCVELGRSGLVNTLECCKTCHSAGRFAAFTLGPCRVTLSGGRRAFVCCSSKKQLLRGKSPETA